MGRVTKTARPQGLPAVRLETENEWAWCGERRLELAPREFAVLRHLVEHAGRLLTKTELLDAVWVGTAAATRSCSTFSPRTRSAPTPPRASRRPRFPHGSPAFRGGQDLGVTSALHAAWVLWLHGYPERSATRMLEALARARTLDHPYTLAFACRFTASFFRCRGDVEVVRELAEVPIACATEYDIEIARTLAAVCRG